MNLRKMQRLEYSGRVRIAHITGWAALPLDGVMDGMGNNLMKTKSAL